MRSSGMLSVLTVSGVSVAALLLGGPAALASTSGPEVSVTAKPAAQGMDCSAHMHRQTMDPAKCVAMHCCDKPGQSGHQEQGTHVGRSPSGHSPSSMKGCCTHDEHHTSSMGVTIKSS